MFLSWYNKTMKETLKLLREKNGLSQTAVADYLEISRGMYIKYETGETDPTVKVIIGLSKLYKVSYDTIIDNKYGKKFSYDDSDLSEGLFVASPLTSYSAGTNAYFEKTYPSTIIGGMYMNKMERLSVSQRKIVQDLIDSFSNQNSTNQKEENEEMECISIGTSMVLRPKHRNWDGFEQVLSQFSDDFMQDGRMQPDHQERESL